MVGYSICQFLYCKEGARGFGLVSPPPRTNRDKATVNSPFFGVCCWKGRFENKTELPAEISSPP